MTDLPTDPVELYRAGGLPEAHALRLALEDAGIPARIDNELLQGVVGDLPLGWPTAPKLLVSRDHEVAARDILAGFLAQRPGPTAADDACLACGAAMGEADTCPACGWSFRADAGA